MWEARELNVLRPTPAPGPSCVRDDRRETLLNSREAPEKPPPGPPVPTFMTGALTLRDRNLRFLLASAAVLGICIVIAHSAAMQRQPDLIALAITFDLTITVPLLYYLMVIRGSGSAGRIIPLFIVAVASARWIVPGGQNGLLRTMGLLSAPLELVAVGAVAWRLRQWRFSASVPGDRPERILQALEAVFGRSAFAGFVASELTVLSYALTGWREPTAPGFTFHRRAGWGTIVCGLLLVVASEALAMHVVLQLWSSRAAWLATALDAWAVLWLFGDYQALRLRTTSFGDETLKVRLGIRWQLDIPLDLVDGVDDLPAGNGGRIPGRLNIAIMEEPRLLIRLREPLTARGLAGIRREVTSVALAPDDESLAKELRSRLEGRECSTAICIR